MSVCGPFCNCLRGLLSTGSGPGSATLGPSLSLRMGPLPGDGGSRAGSGGVNPRSFTELSSTCKLGQLHTGWRRGIGGRVSYKGRAQQAAKKKDLQIPRRHHGSGAYTTS